MLLRRYHAPIEEAKAPELEPGTLAQTDQSAEDAALANAQKIADEQQAQADAANADPDGAQSVAPIIQEAGGVEDNPAETEPPTVPVSDTPATDVGNVDVVTADDLSVATPVHTDDTDARKAAAEAAGLNRGSSTADWRAFAGAGFEESSRDEIATHYLGAK